MAAQLTATATFGALIGDLVANTALVSTGQRVIGGLYPHVVVTESHEDRLQITEHPIETGTPVTDHAFPLPYTVEIRCGWSDSTAQTSGFVQAIYKQLLALQAARQPFSINTGKRNYTSMLMEALGVHTDEENEYALAVTISCKQIVITNTSTGSGSAGDGTSTTNGTNTVGQTGKPGELGTPIDGGADPAPAGSVSGDASGNVSVPNDPVATGTVDPTPAPSAPDWVSVEGGFSPTGVLP